LRYFNNIWNYGKLTYRGAIPQPITISHSRIKKEQDFIKEKSVDVTEKTTAVKEVERVFLTLYTGDGK
jgi:hypothetical protein